MWFSLDPFKLILLLSLVPLVINIKRAKFEVSSFNHSRDMVAFGGGPVIQ